MNRRQFLARAATGFGLLSLAACNGDGNFTIFGYTTCPNYDTSIKTVYVPIFKNQVLMTGPARGLEFQLTQAVVRAIESQTTYKVTSDRSKADTELIGTITALGKNLLNRNQNNEVREAELTLTATVVWRDLRTGEILSNPRRRRPNQPPAAIDPSNPQPEDPLQNPVPVVITSTGRLLPEVGESTATALQMNCNRMAIQIVSMMEIPW
jgi:hypothetical protein